MLIAAFLCAACAATASCAARAAAPAPAAPASSTADLLAVAATLTRFADLANRRDFAPMAELFAEDAVWEASAGSLGFRHESRAAIVRWLAENPGHVEVVFYLASPTTITLHAPDRATTRTSITELLRLQDTGELRQLFGSYTDELVRRDGRWIFAHRRFELRHQQPLAAAPR